MLCPPSGIRTLGSSTVPGPGAFPVGAGPRASGHFVQAGDEATGIALKADGQAHNVVQRGIAQAPLDQTHVHRVQSRTLGNRLLGQPQLEASFADVLTESLLTRGGCLAAGHDGI